jgi:hypothetical protein
MIFTSISPFLIPLVAIVGYFIYRIFDAHYRSKREIPTHADGTGLRRVIEDNVATSKQVLAKLESLEARIGGVEKTLNDIPA